MEKSTLFVLFSSVLSCQNAPQAPPQYAKEKMSETTEDIDLQYVSDILLPQGYERVALTEGAFGTYLRYQKLKKDKTVYLYDGRKKGNQTAQFAVLDVSVGNRDLQQCADAVMRLRAEYLYAKKAYKQIAFHAVSGELMQFIDWANGNHNLLKNKGLSQKLNVDADVSYPNFLKYMNFVFAYASTLSLEKELTTVQSSSDIKVGDVFIKGGAPGHAIIVIELAWNKANGKMIFLLAQSYMPAQNIHILKNPYDPNLSPWYSADFGFILQTPEWDFDKEELRRFKD